MDQVEEIKTRVNIVDLLGEYLTLKRAGRNMSALCPFHNEKSPSFMISAERGSWHCFGCGKGGDIFTFLEEIEGIDFSQALEKLAARAGIKLIKTGGSQQKTDLKNRLFEINEKAAQFYNYLLTKHKLGSQARVYLKGRGVLASSAAKYQLGYAPDSFETLYKFLTKKGFSASEIASSGLVVASQKGEYFDRFRGRIMFPLYDMVGRIVGFSGRILMEGQKEAKYLNTPNTPIFVKGVVLFGLPQAKAAIKSKDQVVLVEGEFDVISSHQAGVLNVLASKGTALTQEQIGLIKRLTENAVICFDADLAGDAAARRGVEMAERAGLNIRVINVVGFKDPDEMAKNDPKKWTLTVEASIGVYDWFLGWATRMYDATDSVGKKKIGAELLPIFGRINDEIVKAHYLSKLARALDVSEEVIFKALEKGGIEVAPQKIVEQDLPQKDTDSLESYFIALLLQGSKFDCSLKSWPEIADFEDQVLKSIYAELIIRRPYADLLGFKDKGEFDLASFAKDKPESVRREVDRLSAFPLGEVSTSWEAWERAIHKTARAIKEKAIKKKLEGLRQKITAGEDSLKIDELSRLNNQFRDLARELSDLN